MNFKVRKNEDWRENAIFCKGIELGFSGKPLHDTPTNDTEVIDLTLDDDNQEPRECDGKSENDYVFQNDFLSDLLEAISNDSHSSTIGSDMDVGAKELMDTAMEDASNQPDVSDRAFTLAVHEPRVSNTKNVKEHPTSTGTQARNVI